MRRLGAVVLLAALTALATAQKCGPAQCYKGGCTDARPLVDFVLLVDDSGSMSPYKTGIVNGLSTWASNLASSNINAAYSIVTFADPYRSTDPRVAQDMTTDFATFKTKLGNGISLNGYWEAGFEALRCIAGTANVRNLNISWRPNAVRILIMMTDEDSDPAMYYQNRPQTQDTCDYLCRYSTRYATTMSASVWATYQQDINYGVAAIKAAKFSYVYLLVKADVDGSTCNTFSQYGNPALQVQNSDFTGFNIAATTTKVTADTESKDSLQGQLLRSSPQIPTRVFTVTDAGRSDFVNNFFAAVTADITQCDECLEYTCSSNKCQTPTNICDCTGTKYGTAVVDCNGVCNGPSVPDCAGVCGGNSRYDECGICSPNGATSSQCKTDCAGNKYVSPKPTANMLLTCASTPTWFQTAAAQAGYIVANSDLQSAAVTGKWTAENVCAHFRGYGQFESRQTCQFDSSYYLSSNPGVTGSAEEHFLTTGMRTGASARCFANTKTTMPPRVKDSCVVCVADPLNPPFCKQDCSGAWRTTQAEMQVVDYCGKCNGNNATLDDCGVCDGNNALKNECNVCGGIRGLNACDLPICDPASEANCNIDCNGESYTTGSLPKNVVDQCGQCLPRGTVSPLCVVDCAGNYYLSTVDSPYWRDPCQNCLPRGDIAATCTQDCAGVYQGDGYYDECGQCISTADSAPTVDTCTMDCHGDYYIGSVAPHIVDDCNTCVLVADTNQLKDNCGVCTNTPNYNSTAECLMDCNNHWYNATDPDHALLDDCGDCVTNRTLFNYRRNPCGSCIAVADMDDDAKWHAGQFKDTAGTYCSCGVDPQPCDGDRTSCIDCPPPNTCPDGVTPKDECNHCPGDDMFGLKDDCGQCCGQFKYLNSSTPYSKCNQDKDDCGICFGFNLKKLENICHVCDASLCVVDCAGTPYGNATYDCAGLCNGNSVCAVCGNGLVENPETCDDGAENGQNGLCNTDCTVVVGALTTGQIVGTVIGAIAAVAIIALLALFGWRYAVSNGLFGMAKKSVDMGASNSNPLYQSETTIASNPLYAGSA